MRRWVLAVLSPLPFILAVQTQLDTGISGNPGVDTTVELGPRQVHSVLHIMSDDIGDEGLAAACAGDCATNMPTLDSLRTNGISFQRYYVTPACASTRTTVLTGRQPFQTGVDTGNERHYPSRTEMEIPEALRLSSAGFKTAIFGKLGVYDDANTTYTAYALMGFDHFWGRTSHNAGNWFGYQVEIGDYPFPTTIYAPDASHYLGDDEFDNATAWIQGLGTGQKFVVFMWTHFAHVNELPAELHDPPTTEGGGAPDANPNGCDTTNAACQIAEVRYMDMKMGHVIDAALAQDSTTLVIYHLDNGDAVVATNGKGTLFQDGIRGEAIFAYGDIPGASKGTTSAEPISDIDIFPTVMDYAGVNNLPPHDRRGYSLRALLSGNCTDTGRLSGIGSDSCWTGQPRCVYTGYYSGRTIMCETAATDGYQYVLDEDGANPKIYELAVSETVECSGASCDAAESELATKIVAYDGLPGPP